MEPKVDLYLKRIYLYPRASLPSTVISSHVWLLSTCNVASLN